MFINKIDAADAEMAELVSLGENNGSGVRIRVALIDHTCAISGVSCCECS